MTRGLKVTSDMRTGKSSANDDDIVKIGETD